MARTNRAGIATFVMRREEYLTAIRADRNVLALETLFFADEIRDPDDVLGTVPARGPSRGKELDMATSSIESMSWSRRPQDYADTYRDRVEQLIDDKRHGREGAATEESPEPTEMSDLVAALAQAQRRRRHARQAHAGRRARPVRRDQVRTRGHGRDLDVKGRSRMTRAALEKAVAGTIAAESVLTRMHSRRRAQLREL